MCVCVMTLCMYVCVLVDPMYVRCVCVCDPMMYVFDHVCMYVCRCVCVVVCC